MPSTFRVASFNVENLFGRAKVFNFKDHDVGDKILEKIGEFQNLLKKNTYSTRDKIRILKLYNEELKPYIMVREDRGKLFKKRGWAVTGVKAKGAGDWDGAVELKKVKYTDVERENTARVIKDVSADVLCIVEADSRPTLKSFDTQLLNNRYKYEMLIDANDQRGIDIGLYSKYQIGAVWSHMFDKKGRKTIFSRDCLEVEVILPGDIPLYVLCNHFKSRGYDFDGKADNKRESQAERVAEILGEYDLTKHWVVVAGDLNDSPDSVPLQPLLNVENLYDVLELQFPNDPMKRWTYHFNKFEQIDFILVSKPLKERFIKAGVERRGIHGLKKLTSSSNGIVDTENEYEKVTHQSNAASDHGAVWVQFDL